MDTLTEVSRRADLETRLSAFVLERHPLALDAVLTAFRSAVAQSGADAEAERLRPALAAELGRRLESDVREAVGEEPPELLPGVDPSTRLAAVREELVEACDGFLRREAIAASLTPEEKLEMLRAMILTRALDNRLKAFFSGGEARWGQRAFQGKGFRSLGQEAVCGAALRLKRGEEYLGPDGEWRGDVIAPMIRDVGAAIVMRHDGETVRRVLNAQVGKAGPPMDGKDLHLGDWDRGILPPAAPLSISVMTMTGVAYAMAREQDAGGESRVAVTFIGEGGTSLGEWHEAINVCAVSRLAAIFCVQNNQTALSTPVGDQTAARAFADKAGLLVYATPSALLATAVADPDPVLYYEHIALYREPKIKQVLGDGPPAPIELGKSALRRAGSDLAIVSYGAYVHRCLAVAERLAGDGIEAAVLDLRSLVPLDRKALFALARHTGKVLVVHEDTRTGGIGESVAAILQEEVFEYLDAPIRILGALDTPVPYSPPLEAAFLPSLAEIERAARLLAAY